MRNLFFAIVLGMGMVFGCGDGEDLVTVVPEGDGGAMPDPEKPTPIDEPVSNPTPRPDEDEEVVWCEPEEPHKVVLCHKDRVTICVSENARPAHLDHDDYDGDCEVE